MAIPNGTQDALEALAREATAAGKPFDANCVYRRGRSDDGGVTGRLVLADPSGEPLRNDTGKEIAVPWCTTGERVPFFRKLD